ncbi:MAG: inositol monophosphatase [Ardenticatenaceae bacterium]|nr:inositol monophosphatase [Ardenticatenaceae bacterium]
MTIIDLEKLLAVGMETAVLAADLTREKFLQPRQLRSKGFRDIVTDADIAAQKVITNGILSHFPDHGFITEEDDSSLPTIGPIRWVIDPIDGTTNYSRQLPEFSISIAAVNEQQEVLVGLIYDPMRAEMFRAIKGLGAWLNEQRLAVSQVDLLAESLLTLDWSRQPEMREKVLTRLKQVAPQVHSVRSIGTAALAQAWVAAGRVDGYFNFSLSAWDVAAGSLLIQEAGGAVSDGDGRPFNWQDTSNGILVSNGLIHNELLRQFA